MLDNATIFGALGLLFGFALGALTMYILQRNPAVDTYSRGYSDAVAEVNALNAGTPPPGYMPTIDSTCTAYSTARPFALLEETP